jgi:hypothetical protein
MLSAMDGQESRRRLATELRQKQKTSHGITRKNTEISRIRISHGRKTYLSEPDA